MALQEGAPPPGGHFERDFCASEAKALCKVFICGEIDFNQLFDVLSFI